MQIVILRYSKNMIKLILRLCLRSREKMIQVEHSKNMATIWASTLNKTQLLS